MTTLLIFFFKKIKFYILNYLYLLNFKEKLRRVERKNRDAFRKMMEEHIAAGTLTAKTYWRDYCLMVLLCAISSCYICEKLLLGKWKYFGA